MKTRYFPTITLRQPWASWITWGLKTIETRTHKRFEPLVGQRIAVHAGLGYDEMAMEEAGYIQALHDEKDQEAAFNRLVNGAQSAEKPTDIFTAGAVVCIATVADFRTLNRTDELKALCSCEGLYGLFLEDVTPLKKPFPAKGCLGIWHIEIPESHLAE